MYVYLINQLPQIPNYQTQTHPRTQYLSSEQPNELSLPNPRLNRKLQFPSAYMVTIFVLGTPIEYQNTFLFPLVCISVTNSICRKYGKQLGCEVKQSNHCYLDDNRKGKGDCTIIHVRMPVCVFRLIHNIIGT